MTLHFFSSARARRSARGYLALCGGHLRRYRWHYGLPLAVVFVLQCFFRIDVNYTKSLPDHVFLTVKGWKGDLRRGQYVVFRFPTENPAAPFRKGDRMVKRIAGLPGDRVEMARDRVFTIHPADASEAGKVLGGVRMGLSKPFSLRGQTLRPGPVGVIPPGRYYVHAPHSDSLDSRYAMMGWIGQDDIVGRAFSLF
jgi:conjugal transfer pilin signal peptidase TrbI